MAPIRPELLSSQIPLLSPVLRGGPEGQLTVPADGCYTFTMIVTDPDNATINMEEADLGGGGPPPSPVVAARRPRGISRRAGGRGADSCGPRAE